MTSKKTAAELFKGLGIPLPTPFRNGSGGGYKHYPESKGTISKVVIQDPRPIDKGALIRWIGHTLAKKPDFIVACDVAAASSLMNYEEHVSTIELISRHSNNQVPILASVGSNATAETIAMARAVKSFVDGLLVVIPGYFIKPPEEGIVAHFHDIRQEISGLPIILYDNYLRTGCTISTETILRLAHQGIIQGVKLASGDEMQLMTILAHRPAGFTVLVANDRHIPLGKNAGVDGVISITANLLPEEIKEAINRYREGKIRLAEGLIDNLRDLIEALEQEINPIPLTTALALIHQNLFKEIFRSPLWPMKPDKKERLVKALRHHGLLA